MNYTETTEYLFSRLPMYSRVGAAAYKADLGNIREICEAIGNPHTTYKTIHLAGTNGKGSCSHMLAAILQVAGYRVGLHTSPHLHDFRERIRVNGEMVSEEFVVRFTETIKPQIDRLDPSFFEISVAMAFEYFREQEVDVAIIETGLGGRLDSTNIITPVLSVITNIGWDHMNLLGNTLEKIAGEKAGIIKAGVPVVIGETLTETRQVFEKQAAALSSPVIFASERYEVMEWTWKGRHMDVQVATKNKTDHLHIETDLPGIYQLKNLVTVLASVDQLRRDGWIITDGHLRQALQQVKKLTGLRGRWDIIGQDPLLVLDVAHNSQGLEQVLAQVEVTDHEQLHIVTGMVNDKEIGRLLAMLPLSAEYYFTQAQIPRAKPAAELRAEGNAAGLKGEAYANVNDAIHAAKEKAADRDMILVCGSIFVVAEVSP
ncbi:MAG: bifunctional folylpolyglutamate synthase/dihydrofolate synthase [Chitinophagaceae bacterium]|nr:MAG: bifunctional folylpolyglutamate synthase/dihydrofolate synthase [Chitinophagaceae bacterium]